MEFAEKSQLDLFNFGLGCVRFSLHQRYFSSFGFDSESSIILWFGSKLLSATSVCARSFTPIVSEHSTLCWSGFLFTDLLLFTLLAWTKGMQRGLNRWFDWQWVHWPCTAWGLSTCLYANMSICCGSSKARTDSECTAAPVIFTMSRARLPHTKEFLLNQHSAGSRTPVQSKGATDRNGLKVGSTCSFPFAFNIRVYPNRKLNFFHVESCVSF